MDERGGRTFDLRDSATTPPRARRLEAPRIAIGVAHNSQVTAVKAALRRLTQQRQVLGPPVVVETANRLQGRRFDVTLVWHPLSGRRDTSEFHLDVGRLCVLLSRHLYGCVVVSRAGIAEQLLDSPSSDGHSPTPTPRWTGGLHRAAPSKSFAPTLSPSELRAPLHGRLVAPATFALSRPGRGPCHHPSPASPP